MSIQMPITKKDLRKWRNELKKKQEIVCLTQDGFITLNLIGLDLASRGYEIKAKIVKGFQS